MNEDLFKSNDIQKVTQEIYRKVIQNDCIMIVMPVYIPNSGIGLEYSNVGKKEAHRQIEMLLTGKGLIVRKIGMVHLIYKKGLSERNVKNAIQEAKLLSYWLES